jgi:DNA modification methylase
MAQELQRAKPMSVRIINADVLDGLAQLEDESVQCCVTSPPYWRLRDYGVAGQIGLEPTPEAFVAKMVDVFREVRRVLSKDGTLWLNIGDGYAAGKMGRDDEDEASLRRRFKMFGTGRPKAGRKGANGQQNKVPVGMKPKDLVGIPWMLAFALRADGWYLRQEIIWAKPNPMPESVRDRCTKAHEHIFLLTKSERYWFDADAIREDSALSTLERFGEGKAPRQAGKAYHKGRHERLADELLIGRNKRSVWTMATQAYSQAHFATFPEELPETCIKAGSRIGDTILDPFVGAGTTGLVADKLGRNAILIELNPEYAAMAEKRIRGSCPMFASVSIASAGRSSEKPLGADELPFEGAPA